MRAIRQQFTADSQMASNRNSTTTNTRSNKTTNTTKEASSTKQTNVYLKKIN